MDKLNAFYEKREPLPAWDLVAASAERKKQGRHAAGRQSYKIEADPQDLVERGLVAADQIEDREAVEAALQQLLDNRLREPPSVQPEKPRVRGRKGATRKARGEHLPLFPDK
jgi:hypothetical protein